MKKQKICACGCEALTKGGEFLPGHDQKLRAALEHTAGGLLELKKLVETHAGPIKIEQSN
ncbi:hypothetical protein ACQU0X_22235 [Pseudovibrio ascidiaceicola]|uniref:hypothetical protein n=1 Tax=Pseudovibrio ascidiaceicola TaxID=285279 RepID=UPI003D360F1B